MTNQSHKDSGLELLFLPDDVLVHIRTSVAKLCGIRDFVALSRTSKLIKILWIVFRKKPCRTPFASAPQTQTRTPRPTTTTSPPKAPVAIRTLEQTAFYEIVTEHDLLQKKTRVYGSMDNVSIRKHARQDEQERHHRQRPQSITDRNTIAIIKAVHSIYTEKAPLYGNGIGGTLPSTA